MFDAKAIQELCEALEDKGEFIEAQELWDDFTRGWLYMITEERLQRLENLTR